jgi:hypothetical protein
MAAATHIFLNILSRVDVAFYILMRIKFLGDATFAIHNLSAIGRSLDIFQVTKYK